MKSISRKKVREIVFTEKADFKMHIFKQKETGVVTENSKDHPGRHFYFTSAMFLQPPADF